MTIAAKRSSMILFSDPRDHYSHRVRMVLEEKGVTVELSNSTAAEISKDMFDLNPYGSLPTLADRNLELYEANFIIENLHERYPHPPLVPGYPVQRAQARLWISRIEKEWSEKLDILMSGKGREATITKLRKELRESILSIIPVFSEKPFFMSDEFSLVDCCVAPILWRLKEVGIMIPERSSKALVAYMQNIFERDAFRESLTEAEQEMQE